MKFLSSSIILMVFLVIGATSITQAQQNRYLDINDPLSFYYRVMTTSTEDMPSYSIRPVTLPVDTVLTYRIPFFHPWRNHALVKQQTRFLHEERKSTPNRINLDGITFDYYTPVIRTTRNTNIPWGYNDGALWQGLGWNQFYTTGIGFQVGNLRGSFRPEFTYNANEYYGVSPFRPPTGINRRGNPVQYIDTPQRFGRKVNEVRPEEDAYSTFYPGESFIEYQHRDLAFGLSTKAMWTGPAVYNPLILSTNAPGFAHGYVSTVRPIDIPLAELEAKWFWGTLRESLLFDADSTNNKRFVTGFTVSVEPDFMKGLYIGMNRVSYKYFPADGLTLSDMVLAFRPVMEHPTQPIRRLDLSQHWVTMTSFFVRHVMPEVGFEWYYERGYNSYKREIRDKAAKPMLNWAYTIGFIKRFDLGSSNYLAWNIEHTILENNDPHSYIRFLQNEDLNDVTTWYSNDYIRQGYTHKGKVIGGGIGPGSSAQTMQFTWYNRWGALTGVLGRIAHHNDRIFENYNLYFDKYDRRNGLVRLQDVEVNMGGSALVFLPYGLELEAAYRYTYRYRFWNTKNLNVANTNLSFTVRYNLRAIAL